MDKNKYVCVCCGYKTIERIDPLYHEICPVCYWENDPIQNCNPRYAGGANKVSLNEAKENYKKFGATEKEHIKYVRKPFKEEI